MRRGRGDRLSLTISAKPVGAWVTSQPLILRDGRSGLLTRIALMESVSFCTRMRSWRRLSKLAEITTSRKRRAKDGAMAFSKRSR
jgi:hypothetical protein